MIHENILLRNNFRPLFFEVMSGNITLISALLGILTILVSFILAIIYRLTLGKINQTIFTNFSYRVIRFIQEKR